MTAGAWALASVPGVASAPSGNASTPQAFVDFCKREPAECTRQATHGPFNMSPAMWIIAQHINARVNAQVEAVDDQTIYQRAEYWTIAKTRGDCEDFVLLKKHLLRLEGFPDNALLITIVRNEKNEGHAVLTLATPEGDFILDNRRDGILAAAATGYHFLKRQSADDPMRWVSLQSAPPRVIASTDD